MRAGNAGSGPLIRRRRREVALAHNISDTHFFYLTQNLRLTYDLERVFYNRYRRKDISMAQQSDSLSAGSLAVRLVDHRLTGPMMVTADKQGVVGVASLTCEDAKIVQAQKGEPGAAAIAEKAAKELTQYAAGERREFDVPLALDGLAPFQRAVLAETARIPMGSVASYGEIAARIGKPKSGRAVGGALARNPIGIIIPCHRVVAHDGRLHGFSSPEGIAGKARLLQHEGVVVENDRVILRKESRREER